MKLWIIIIKNKKIKLDHLKNYKILILILFFSFNMLINKFKNNKIKKRNQIEIKKIKRYGQIINSNWYNICQDNFQNYSV